ncbi:MAG: sigma factor [Prolixibacteraceae bacterium]|nr:hypothetical protein [Bacteroidales bacterium]OQB79587.1 MAG: RNA polymerase sigma factor [Bacteroidetes bacterium ADurb.Bin123]HNU78252.1 sigma factor [Prolixibacteraceae bacterium]HNZ69260.1 sigma factor [Prolixibacteraceae bacterium]HOC85520.1 sigma factor [Prolixibacteraceae bacterium]
METEYQNIHQALIDRCRSGDRKAQEEIYRVYCRTMYCVSLRITGNSADAEDVMQEAFLSAFRKIGTLMKKLELTTAYGSVRVDHIPAGFEFVNITSGCSQVSLGIAENAGYQVDAVCDYCNIVYPQGEFKGNRIKENTRERINGKVGSGTDSRVSVTSKYGNIKLSR